MVCIFTLSPTLPQPSPTLPVHHQWHKSASMDPNGPWVEDPAWCQSVWQAWGTRGSLNCDNWREPPTLPSPVLRTPAPVSLVLDGLVVTDGEILPRSLQRFQEPMNSRNHRTQIWWEYFVFCKGKIGRFTVFIRSSKSYNPKEYQNHHFIWLIHIFQVKRSALGHVFCHLPSLSVCHVSLVTTATSLCSAKSNVDFLIQVVPFGSKLWGQRRH